MSYQVLIVDDQTMPRQLFSIFVQNAGRYEVAAALPDADAAVEYCKTHMVEIIFNDQSEVHAVFL